MSEGGLRNSRILVVEDEYFIANELSTELEDAGAIVLGPIGTIDGALAIINAELHIDAAILDINLQGDMVFPAGDLLMKRGIPFMFTTGYDAAVLPDRFDHILRCEKPVEVNRVTEAIERVIYA